MSEDNIPENRGISGQPLSDTSKPGDPHTGKPEPGPVVNIDPTSREDEGY